MNRYEKVLLIGAGFWWLGEELFGPLFAIFTGKVGGDVLEVSSAELSSPTFPLMPCF